ncbi:uncharacterized protein F4812DRAFT_438364 [Daldinia caldariorum]|uniref:uncharacterized protein n=1 Tax=Daldinia caldariorum TaxID=326644 RepID=UPI002008E2CD|nr:uncharacterized protein F4812DRAFT_438364 [Daldinia caldariorum]KAI1465343.1 hypothetical protein F4812DRAFT_438364 [Daldinia caldariorum]
MERKRKLPARAAARVEHVSKKRTATPPERSVTPVAAALSTPAPAETAPEDPPLPKSIQAGNPLPTVEHPQPDDLLSKDYQSIQESGVLAESLSRSRQKWVHEGVFEKYWTKPTKRKGVVKEDPNNPPKDSMTKIGQVTITVEPHVLEATMYAVKDPKPAPTTNSAFRPIVQYGPPNGTMPPPKPSTASTPNAPSASPSQAQAQPPSQPSSAAQPPVQAQIPTPSQSQVQQSDLQRPPSATIPLNKPLASPRGLESVLAAPQHPSTLPPATGPSQPAPPQPRGPSQPVLNTNRPLHAPSPGAIPAVTGPTIPAPAKPVPPATKPATPAAPGADPIIVTLAERASEDPQLRDLMKRVAIGDAAPAELAHFQKIIDQITADYKRKGGQQGPSADRLIVDGRTVKYFADEVRTILDIVLASNPHQRSNDLRTPPGSDPLVILLVRKALDDMTTRDIVRRVAEGKTKFTDTTDLKTTLDKLKDLVVKETPKPQQATTGAPQTPTTNGVENPTVQNGSVSRKASLTGSGQTTHASSSQQALRSKGPPPSTKPDISAIVLEFSGGTGDRYLFPKYSIIEFVNPTQAIASFLIVRKGSKLEYGGDPALDYYQPVTIRIYAQSPKHLESLARVVAPQDEVQRYMDDVMDNMTRAEYVLLAMRLPRADKEEQAEEGTSIPKADPVNQPQQPGVLWNSKASSTATPPQKPITKPLGDDEQYQSFIATVS